MRVPVSSSLSLISWPRRARSTSKRIRVAFQRVVHFLDVAGNRLCGLVAGLGIERGDFLGNWLSKPMTSSEPTRARVSFTSRPRSAIVSAWRGRWSQACR